MPEKFESFFDENNYVEDDIYDEDTVEELLEEDIISPEEEGFMRGYLMNQFEKNGGDTDV